jgi:uncharacterized protein YbcI
MPISNSAMARKVCLAACDFERRRTGSFPKSVTVVLSESALVITLHGALSPAEMALARSPSGAAKVQDFHRRLFDDTADSLREEIRRITGVVVCEAVVEVEPTSGTVVKAFTSGTVVEVFLLADSVTAGAWSGNGNGQA